VVAAIITEQVHRGVRRCLPSIDISQVALST
jgi:hypothetical protein